MAKMTRLMDYLFIVGNNQPLLDSTQAPELLRCFPEQPHKDFPLPVDVVFFCQPEGCVSASKRLSLKDTNSFVFMLTEKDSGIVRYGMCCNFFRPCIGLKTVKSETSSSSSHDDEDLLSDVGRNESKRLEQSTQNGQDNITFKSTTCRSLTSICIVSEQPFLSTFRECLFVLRKIIESRVPNEMTLGKVAQTWNIVTEGNHTMKCVPNHNLKNWSMFLNPQNYEKHPEIKDIHEIEDWINRLLIVPSPIPGCNRIEVELLPRHVQPPLTFALPEKSRFSMLDFPLHLPLELLGVDTCLKVLTCIIMENKVLLQSDDYNALSISVMALTSMLYPLEYMFPVIPLLPTCMKNAEQLLLAPTPYVIGVPSSFLQYKSQYFQFPSDVLIVDLDSSKMCVPLTMDEIPSLPEPEGSILREQLKQCLDCLSLYPHCMPDLEAFADDSMFTARTSTSGSKLSEIVYGNDIDSVDVAIRASLTKFFTSPSVLGEFAQHCRILRLYSRPVVAFQRDSFVTSRQPPSDLIQALAETQAMEFFAEWLVNPTNTVYRKVHGGILDPRVIGDKPRWYSHYLDPIYYQIHNPHSTLGHDLGDDSDDSGPLYEDDEDISDSDFSIDEEEVFQLQKQMAAVHDPDVTTKAKEQISELYDSSYSSYNTIENEEKSEEVTEVPVNTHPALNAQTSVFRKRAHRQESLSPCSEEAKVFPNTVQSILDPNRRSVYESNEDKPSSPENNDSVFKRGPLAHGGSIGQKAKDVLSRQGSSASERINALMNHIKPKLSQRSSVESEMSVQSFLSSGSSECNSIPTSPMPPRAHSYPYPLSEIEESNTLRWSNTDRFLERSSSFPAQKAIKDPRIHNGENQQLINDVVASVLKGDGVSWFSQKKLRRLLIHESLRNYLFKQLYEPKEQNEDDEAINDVHVSRNVYRSIVELFQFILEGYEHSAKQKGIGGLSSVFLLLEIMHTHYCGKRIQDSGVNGVKKIEERSRNGGENSRLNLAVDAKSDSSIVYTREASPIRSSDERVSSIFRRNGDFNDNSITPKMNGDANSHRSTESPRPFATNSSLDRDSFDAVFEATDLALRRLSLERRNSSHTGSLDDDIGAQGTVKRFPSLSHSALTSKSSTLSSRSVGDLSTTTIKELIDDRNLVCKSNSCNGYRFRNGKLHEAKKERVSKGISGTGRRFVFEGLLSPRAAIWDDMSFWEHCFYDSVAAEREVVGMDIGPVELLERYKSLGPHERRCLEEDEDKILSTVLHNMIAFMLTVQIDKTKIRRKIGRLLGKSHIGLYYTQHINTLLDNLEKLDGNDIDLKPLKSRTMKKQVFVVHLGEDSTGPMFFLEVCDDCMLIKGTNGGIVERWWYENLVNMSCSPRAKILCLWIKAGEQTELQKISTKKCKSLYTSIKESMEKTARKFKGLEPGMELGGEFDVVDAHTNKKGLLRVSLDGVSIIFIDGKCTIDVRNLKNCSRKETTLYIQEYVPHTQQIIEHELFSAKAGDICYSVLCLFSYLAAASNGSSSEARGSEGASSL